MDELPLSKAFQLIEPGPVVLVTVPLQKILIFKQNFISTETTIKQSSRKQNC